MSAWVPPIDDGYSIDGRFALKPPGTATITKRLIYSDLHLEFASLEIPSGAADQADVLVHAGDIHTGERGVSWAVKVARKGGKAVDYAPGNHEFYGYRRATQDRADWLWESRELGAGLGVHVLDREALAFEDVRFLGTTLCTDFQLFAAGSEDKALIDKAMADAAMGLNDFTAIRENGRRFIPTDAAREHALRRAWLLERLAEPWEGRTVVVTHHAPRQCSAAVQWRGRPLNPSFACELPADFFQGIDLWFHGHMHDSADYMHHHGCRIVCNPRGYPTSTLPLNRNQFENRDHVDLIIEV